MELLYVPNYISPHATIDEQSAVRRRRPGALRVLVHYYIIDFYAQN